MLRQRRSPAGIESPFNAIFAATGQTCIAGSRLFVHERAHDELAGLPVAKARERAAAMLREFITEEILGRIARQLGTPDATERAWWPDDRTRFGVLARRVWDVLLRHESVSAA